MAEMTEKERFLKVATPQEWDCWLTIQADYLVGQTYVWPELQRINERFKNTGISDGCLFCAAYKSNHKECMPHVYPGGFIYRCLSIPKREKIDAAIARPERAGIWEE